MCEHAFSIGEEIEKEIKPIGFLIYHDILGWHVPNGEYFNNGCSICKHCEKEIMQDSQGNWF